MDISDIRLVVIDVHESENSPTTVDLEVKQAMRGLAANTRLSLLIDDPSQVPQFHKGQVYMLSLASVG